MGDMIMEEFQHGTGCFEVSWDCKQSMGIWDGVERGHRTGVMMK
jgi:hypothetical protein